jgi:hypothetical protein
MQDFKIYNLRARLSLILLVVDLLGVVSFGDLVDILNQSVFQIRSANKLHELLGTLKHFNQIAQVGDHYYVFVSSSSFPIRNTATGGMDTKLRLTCRGFYQKHYPQLFQLMTEDR